MAKTQHRIIIMNSGHLAQAVNALNQAGAAVVVQLPGAHGSGGHVQVLPIEAEELVADPRAFIASKLGVTVDQLDAWDRHGHVPKCGGWTRSGSRCGNSISPHTMVEPAAFAAAHRLDHCHVHG
jgi:hypothetical protein